MCKDNIATAQEMGQNDHMSVRWRLADFLEQRSLSAYALGKAMGTSYMNTVYRLARRGDEPTRVDLPTLSNVLDGLRKLTGEDVKITDVLEYIPDSEA